MPRFSEYFQLNLAQHQLDFVDISNEYDIPVYVDPYAIEIRNDIWASQASEHIRTFFKEVLKALKDEDLSRATSLMSHLNEPKETFFGVSKGPPKGRGVGPAQSQQLISAIIKSKAYQTNLLSDLSEVSLYVEGIDRDKISDLTTNIIRGLLADYTKEQCDLYGIETKSYKGPPMWDIDRLNWINRELNLPYIEEYPILLIPKYIVRRKLSLDSQEFYNKQMTDFFVAETEKANGALVQTLKGKERPIKVLKSEVREKNPKSKLLITETIMAHPELLDLLKKMAKNESALINFNKDDPSLTSVCASLANAYKHVPKGREHADFYHSLVLGSLTALFYPDLIQPHKEWEINDGRKRVDIVFTNSANEGFFSQRRDDRNVNANTVIVECKNYSDDIANEELDQLLGRFDHNRGYLGIITCREIDNKNLLLKRCRDAAVRSKGYIITLTDSEITSMLVSKSQLQDEPISNLLYKKYRELLQ